MVSHAVVFLVFDGVKMLDVTGPAEVFAEANRAGATYKMFYASPRGRQVATSIGTDLRVGQRVQNVDAADTIVVAGGDRLAVEPIERELIEATRLLITRGKRIASICTGAFLLASTGALDGRRAATHWRHAGILQRAFPNVRVDPDALFVRDGRFHTSAGVSSGIDLALSLIEADHGAVMARDVARQLVVPLQRQGGQSQFSAALSSPLPRTDPVRLAVDAIAADPARAHTLDGFARIAGVSARHLSRLFQDELGTSPMKLLEDHRIDLATNLLFDGNSVSATARRSGFSSSETLRRVFVARFGIPPRRYQQQFAPAK